MEYEFRNGRTKLAIKADEEDRKELTELKEYDPDKWGTTQAEIEMLETMLANSELQWIDPADTGDLTDCPILGIVGGDDETTRQALGPYGAIHGGADESGPFFYPILERWGYTPYALRTFLEDLLEDGEAVFVNSN